MKKMDSKRRFLIDRLGYMRSRAKLSARELSQRVDKSIAYFAKFDNGDFSIPAEVLLDAIEVCSGTPEEFFWEDISNYAEQKKLIKQFSKLSPENKQTIMELIEKLR